MPTVSRRLTLSLVAIILAISTLGTPAVFAVARPGAAASPVRGVARPAAAPGTPSVAELGSSQAEVAARHKLSVTELQKRLRTDKRLAIGMGRLVFKEPVLAGLVQGPALQATALPAGTLTATTPSPAQAFALHSLPGAKRVIYLDFDGHTMSGNAWTAQYNGGRTIVAPPFDTNGSPTTFSDAERNVIVSVWQRVAEDYAPFDVDVTTEYTGESSITRSGGTDEYYGMRVLISPISSYFGSAGIAYVGVFGASGDYYKPALVFNDILQNNEKNIAEACSHECGHTLGLYHDGQTTAGASYYWGHGTGDTSWAPIMGAAYYRNLTQWSKGEYSLANNREDDLAIIGANIPPRPDDYGNANTSAYVVPSGTTFSVDGMIERSTDVDVLKLSVGSGGLNITLAPATRGPDMDLLAELRNSSGAMVASANPADMLNGSLSANVVGW